MIDHMMMNQVKYYPGQVPNYIGKTLKMPRISCYTYTFDIGDQRPRKDIKVLHGTKNYDDLYPQDLGYELHPKVAGQLLSEGLVFLLIPFYDHIDKRSHFVWIKLSEYLQNRGVSHSPLTHLYHASHLIRKEISMAIKKIKYQLEDWYSETEPSYLGKTITVPNKHGLTQYRQWKNSFSGGYGGKYSLPLKKTKVVAESATMQGRDWDDKSITDRWVYCGEMDSASEPIWRRVGEIFEIGGVSHSPLTHLYQAVTTSRRVVLA